MLEKVLRELNNWFLVEVYRGEYSIEKGGLSVDFLRPGQYFRVLGSVFNDGLYRFPTADLKGETFDGSIWALAVPREVVELAEEIKAWREKYEDTLNSPFTTESFGGYTYTKASAGGDGAANWKRVFSADLSKWRKIGGVR